MSHIEIYSGDFCPYCTRAKSLLQKKGLEYIEYNVQSDLKHQNEMVERAGGARTIPQIFIDGKHIGGCDELYALESKGELDALLKTKHI